jgi:hypothetical protein
MKSLVKPLLWAVFCIMFHSLSFSFFVIGRVINTKIQNWQILPNTYNTKNSLSTAQGLIKLNIMPNQIIACFLQLWERCSIGANMHIKSQARLV